MVVGHNMKLLVPNAATTADRFLECYCYYSPPEVERLYWGYIGILENKMETTISGLGFWGGIVPLK